MLRRELGSTGETVPAVGQGTWLMGGTPDTDRAAVRALQLGFDLGMTLVDTAEMYGEGHAERLVGEALRGRREDVFVVSKLLPSHADREGVRRAAEGSLRRLDIEAIDLYLLHWPSASVPVTETMEAMQRLVEQGKVRYAGVSNFELPEMDRAAKSLHRAPLVCNQVLYHLEDRGVEYDLIPGCEERKVTVMAYSPFGHRGLPGADTVRGRVLRRIARRRGCTPHQVALRRLLMRPSILAIPKAVREAHVRANASVFEVELQAEDAAAIDEAFPPPEGPTPLGII